jgi:hypothetical protein
MGEWSNPSDEERARHEQIHRDYMRQMAREMQEQEQPRRLPEFPRPPERQPTQPNDDDDIISNPSDEERQRNVYQTHPAQEGLYPPASGSSRPLPQVPHSREPSYQYSYYGSLPAHSREPSENQLARIPPPEPVLQVPPPVATPTGRKDLNPFAKPFVFGGNPSFTLVSALPSVPVSVNSDATPSPAQTSAPTHSRHPSLASAKALNAAAPEFKPGGFTFQAPEGVPKLTFPEHVHMAETSRPLPQPPLHLDPRSKQGREKRMKTSVSDIADDSGSDDEIREGHDSIQSFRFPTNVEQSNLAKSAPTSPGAVAAANRAMNTLNASAKPFTFSGFSNMPPVLPPLLGQDQRSLTDTLNAADFLSINATHGSGLGEERRSPDLTLPSIHKQKRAPIPLDFKHPVSTNMVPAGLFKNMPGVDAESGRPSRAPGPYDLSDDRSDVSLDDSSMPAISGKIGRRAVMPEDLDASEGSEDEYELNNSEERDAQSTATSAGSPESRMAKSSYMQPEIASYSQGLRLEERLEAILCQKIDELRRDLSVQRGEGHYISTSTDELVREAMAMFRTQLWDSASKAMDDSVKDAAGEMDFSMIQEIVEQGHEESRKRIHEDLDSLLRNVRNSGQVDVPVHEILEELQQLKSKLVSSNEAFGRQLNAISEVTHLQDNKQDREGLIVDLLAALTPHLAAIRSEPIDYDGLTQQLSQAVKPHIIQLIDLASDKRETAGLIVAQLTPILEDLETGITSSQTANLVSEITASVNRAIAPIDTYAIKEQVADLVVERLDSRLATRDNDVAINFKEIKGKMGESLVPLVGRFDFLDTALKNLSSGQNEVAEVAKVLTSKNDVSKQQLEEVIERLKDIIKSSAESNIRQTHRDKEMDNRLQVLAQVQNSVSSLVSDQEGSTKAQEEILALNREIRSGVNAIPDIVSSLGSSDAKHDDIVSRLKAIESASQETRKFVSQISDLQNQLQKARSQHGQARVQCETTNGKLQAKENECDELRARIADMQAAALKRDEEVAALKERDADHERAMQSALDRLKASDVSSQSQKERLSQLEKENRELSREKVHVQSKVLFLNASFHGSILTSLIRLMA